MVPDESLEMGAKLPTKTVKMRPNELEKLKKFHKNLRSKFLDNTKCMIQFQFMISALRQIRNQKSLIGIAR
jgi:hypothetical protein